MTRSAEEQFLRQHEHETCWKPGCFESTVLNTGLCAVHAMRVYTAMKPLIDQQIVKIGTTIHLRRRMQELGSHKFYKNRGMDYVIGLELGGRDLELKRHNQFIRDRIGRTEDFVLSEELARHIRSLARTRDGLLDRAMNDSGLQVVYYLTNAPVGQSV